MSGTLIIGSGLAGWTVARELRKLDAAAAITLVCADAGDFYPKPMLSNALAQGRSALQLVTTAAAKMAEQQRLTLHAKTRITAIDRQRQQVHSDRGADAYARLVLALGASPIRLPLAGDAAAAVFSVNDLDDYARFREALAGRKSVAIIGAGLIGCEFANDLAATGIRVSVIDPAPSPIAALLPTPAGERLLAPLADLGVGWHLGRSTAAVERDGVGFRLHLDDGSVVAADLVLSAVGLRPRTELAAAAGIDCERGIRVDAELRTSDPAVFALGDCAQYTAGTLPFVMPIMHAARALAATLAGTPTPLRFPAMPVIIKTPAHPVVVAPPARGLAGTWHSDEQAGGLAMEFVAADGRMRGFVLTGSRVGERNAMLARLSLD